MDIINTATSTPWLFLTWILFISLVVGSFLNVVIHRLPIMMDNESYLFCHDYMNLKTPIPKKHEERFDLILPLSHCPKCNYRIKPWHNIPLFSYLFLKGKCASCKVRIPIRYFLVELFCGVSSVFIAHWFGFTWQTLFALLFNWTLIALLFIDIDHQLLPDILTIMLLWLGLLASVFTLFCNSQTAILGAIAGYLTFWAIATLFKWVVKKDAMGYGDFKLLAALGAWLGWEQLPLVVFISAFAGLIGTLLYAIIKQKDMRGVPTPFGPYLVIAGWIGLLWGNPITHWYLYSTGVM